MSRGWQGAVLKLLRAGDYRLTVTGRCEISQHYLRLSFDGGGLLTDRPLHPTMWIRMWFADGDKLHQRGYTLVDPDPAADTVDIEFALHDGVASRWAQEAQPGDTIDATVLGSNLTLPEPGRPATSSSATPPRFRRSARCSTRSATRRPGCSWRPGTTTTRTFR